MATEGAEEPTAQLPADGVPDIAPLALVAAGRARTASQPTARSGDSAASNTTAVAAMRDEEIERTRLFIRMGWVLSIAVMATEVFVDAPLAMSIALAAGLVVGMIVSYGYHRAFADPKNYTERALLTLAVLCTINGSLGVMYYGAFSGAPLMVVVGIHFVARTEAERVARWILASASAGYAVIAFVIVTGIVDDPGVFASDRDVGRPALIVATAFVLGTFVFAYQTARMFRFVSLAAIEENAAATRLASQREALMDELRADLERALRIGGPGRYSDRVVGKYKLGVVIGRGAIGEVYEAAHVDTGEPAAVKLLRRELLADPTQVARFLREARASIAIESRHVVRVLDALGAGASPAGDGPAGDGPAGDGPAGDGASPAGYGAAPPYLATERLHGQTLAEQLRAGAITPDATLELVRHVSAGIDAAAAAGIVHRDLKPQNLMRHDGVWKILDFGVAAFTEESAALTRGEAVGTPHYMSPEQAQGKQVDRRADVYALGAIVYRCLTGSHPFHGGDTPSLLYAVVHRMPLRPGGLTVLAADADRWFALALAKSPDDRFATGAALADAFAAALAGELDGKLRSRADALIRKHPWEGT